MELVDQPNKFPIPFAADAGPGFIHQIPEASQIPITPGAASLTDGFPPLTFLPKAAGGVPPFGQDINGILQQTTALVRWIQAGGLPTYDAAYSTAIGGYPKGAILVKANGVGFWISTTDNNVTDPDTGGAGWTSMSVVPNYMNINSATTLTPAQVGGDIDIQLFGSVGFTLTLPLVSGLSRGSRISIINQNAQACTISCNGTDTVFLGVISGLTSFVMQPGDSVMLAAQPTSFWVSIIETLVPGYFSINTSGGLTTTQIQKGAFVQLFGTTAITLQIPPAANTSLGVPITIVNNSSQIATIARGSASDTFFIGNVSGLTSFTIHQGDTVTLYCQSSANGWVAGGGTMPLINTANFASSLGSTGFQRLPSGLIMQWGPSSPSLASGNATTTFANAFPTAALSLSIIPNQSGTGNFAEYSTISTTGFTHSIWSSSSTQVAGVGSLYIALGH